MKNLIYSSVLLSVFLLVASCKKGELVDPQTPTNNVVNQTILHNCDTTKLVEFSIANYTGVGSYKVTFSGAQSYTFDFPVNGSSMVAVKAGSYTLAAYTLSPTLNQPGLHFLLNDTGAATGFNAIYRNVLVSPCSVARSLNIESVR